MNFVPICIVFLQVGSWTMVREFPFRLTCPAVVTARKVKLHICITVGFEKFMPWYFLSLQCVFSSAARDFYNKSKWMYDKYQGL